MVDTTARRGAMLREVSRRAVQAEITSHGLRLFAEQGFDATTVEQIAAAAGVSSRSFFRYFATKEDVVIGDAAPAGHLLAATLKGRPDDETAGQALRSAIVTFMNTIQEDPGRAVQQSRLMLSTPSLRARHLEKQQFWIELLLPEILRRLGPDSPPLRAKALVSTALACLDIAVLEWAGSDGTLPIESLLDATFEAVTTELPGTARPKPTEADRSRQGPGLNSRRSINGLPAADPNP